MLNWNLFGKRVKTGEYGVAEENLRCAMVGYTLEECLPVIDFKKVRMLDSVRLFWMGTI